MDLDRIATLCQTLRFQGDHECELQDALEELFKSASLEVTREVMLEGRDRIDFLIGRLGIEVKVDGSPMQVTRQLRRYVESDLLDELVVVTTRAKHKTIPKTVGGKPVRVVWLPPF